MNLRSQKSVNNTDDFLILRLTEIPRIQKCLECPGYRFQPQRQRPMVLDRPDVRGGEDPREIEMTRRETTSPETASTRLVSTMKCTVRPNYENDRQQSPNFSSLDLRTYTYTML